MGTVPVSVALDQRAEIVRLKHRNKALRLALKRAHDTFEDMEKAHMMLGRVMLAEAARIAKQDAMEILARNMP